MRDIYNVRSALELLALDTAIAQLPQKELDQVEATFRRALEDYRRDRDALSPETMYHLDNLFHNLFIEHTSNYYIRKLMPSLSERIQLGQLRAYVMTDTFEESTLQHLRIIEALEAHNLSQAKDLLKAHLEWSYKVMFDAILKDGKNRLERNAIQ